MKESILKLRENAFFVSLLDNWDVWKAFGRCVWSISGRCLGQKLWKGTTFFSRKYAKDLLCVFFYFKRMIYQSRSVMNGFFTSLFDSDEVSAQKYWIRRALLEKETHFLRPTRFKELFARTLAQLGLLLCCASPSSLCQSDLQPWEVRQPAWPITARASYGYAFYAVYSGVSMWHCFFFLSVVVFIHM